MEDHGFVPNIVFRSDNFDAVRGLVRSSLGISMIPSLAYLEGAGIGVVPVSDHLPQRHISAMTRRADKNPLIDDFMVCLKATAANLTPNIREGHAGGR